VINKIGCLLDGAITICICASSNKLSRLFADFLEAEIPILE
jgi:hypothetical protein